MTEKQLFNFMKHVKINRRTGCHEWTGALSRDCYGRVKQNGKCVQTHRVAWEHANARAIKDGYEIDHLCENECCCNPAHLEEVTKQENLRRKQIRIAEKLGLYLVA